MKVIAFNGSPRKDGNTVCLINHVFKVLNANGIETEMIQLGGNMVHGCMACYKCFENKDHHCVMKKDIINDCIDKMREADGIIFASPTYFADVTTELKALIDRSGLVNKANDGFLKRKVGAGIVAVRRGGEIHVFDTINHYFLISEMVIPGSCYWNMGFGREKGEVENDEEGIRTMRILGENMSWLMKKLK
ncbi:MAG: flavodoxin family protein [bacterium]